MGEGTLAGAGNGAWNGAGTGSAGGRASGQGFGPVRQALLAICLAAAALAGDDRPAGASQLCKAGSFAPGYRSEASRPQKPRLPAECGIGQTAVLAF